MKMNESVCFCLPLFLFDGVVHLLWVEVGDLTVSVVFEIPPCLLIINRVTVFLVFLIIGFLLILIPDYDVATMHLVDSSGRILIGLFLAFSLCLRLLL